jgi:hypothetical protein
VGICRQTLRSTESVRAIHELPLQGEFSERDEGEQALIIFLDESGDLGFNFEKQKTSRKFVITLLVCDGADGADGFKRAVRRTLKNKLNHKKGKDRVVQELKGTGTTLTIKEYFFRQISASGWGIYTVALNKVRVEEPLRSKQGKKKLYKVRKQKKTVPVRPMFPGFGQPMEGNTPGT